VRIVLKVYSTNPEYSAGCDFALLDLTREFVKLALSRMDALEGQQRIDPDTYETYYWCSHAEYLGLSPTLDLMPRSPEDTSLRETLEEFDSDDSETCLLAEDTCIPENLVARAECQQMIVRANSIAFIAIPKHTDFYITSAELHKSVLESYLPIAASV
jgi:hypothetical protein